MDGHPAVRLPLGRTGALVAAMTTAAVGAHVAGGGAVPTVHSVVLVVVAVAWVAVVVMRGRLPRSGRVALVGASQYAVHHLLVLTTAWQFGQAPPHAGGCGPVGAHAAVGSHAATAHAAAAACAVPGASRSAAPLPPPPSAHPSPHGAVDGGTELGMALTHAVATGIVLLLVAQGDRVLRAALAAWWPSWHSDVRALPPVALRRWVVTSAPPAMPTGRLQARSTPRRGPPGDVGAVLRPLT